MLNISGFLSVCNFLQGLFVKGINQERKQMKKLGIILVVTFVVLVFVAGFFTYFDRSTIRQVSESEITRTIHPREFHKIDVRAVCDVEFVQGNTTTVRVQGMKNQVDNLALSVEDGTLMVRDKDLRFYLSRNSSHSVRLLVSSPDLTDVVMRGPGDFESLRRLDTDVLHITLNGNGDIHLTDVICDQAQFEMNGSGDIEFDRLECQESSIRLAGSGDVDAKLVNVDKSTVELFGAGDISVDFLHCGYANCRLFGAGDITLTGDLKRLDKDVKGAGDFSVDALNLQQ